MWFWGGDGRWLAVEKADPVFVVDVGRKRTWRQRFVLVRGLAFLLVPERGEPAPIQPADIFLGILLGDERLRLIQNLIVDHDCSSKATKSHFVEGKLGFEPTHLAFLMKARRVLAMVVLLSQWCKCRPPRSSRRWGVWVELVELVQ